jgi:HK97 family phage portal protein
VNWWQQFLEWLRPGQDVAAQVEAIPWWATWWGGTSGQERRQLYAKLYRTQPHVRTVVDFLACQLGQLGIGVYRRISDTDRVRVPEHPLSRLLQVPNAYTPRYRWVSELVMDFGIFGNGYAIKARPQGLGLQLYRVPAAQVQVQGDLVPRLYVWTLPGGQQLPLPPSAVFHLRQYDPDSPITGLSPLESLAKLLLEEQAATEYRAAFWKNAAKLGGIIQRPKDAPRWSPEQRQMFSKDWRRYYAGARNAGRTAVLEDGMTFNPITATARDSQLVETRKLTREEVAAAYHVPPAMIGIVESQGYGSLREQHRALYQDTLGPYVALLEGELQLQILPEFSDAEDVYVQFNINEKLQGAFEEEAAALNTGVGSPYMTRNEARARLNLPRINDAAFDVPVTRLDVAEGQHAKSRATPPAPASAARNGNGAA